MTCRRRSHVNRGRRGRREAAFSGKYLPLRSHLVAPATRRSRYASGARPSYDAYLLLRATSAALAGSGDCAAFVSAEWAPSRTRGEITPKAAAQKTRYELQSNCNIGRPSHRLGGPNTERPAAGKSTAPKDAGQFAWITLTCPPVVGLRAFCRSAHSRCSRRSTDAAVRAPLGQTW